MTTYWAAHAWLPDGLADGRPDRDRRRPDHRRHARGPPSPTDHRLPGVVLPGFANTHSHAFHRALRGRTHDGGGTFWTWRDRMYALAATLTPDTYLDLARATYAEMVLAGVTAVGEFHYLHHAPGGTPYDDPNVMAEALRTAARDAGLRITLLDTAYLTGGIDAPLEGAQRRFGDRDADAWAARVAAIRPDDTLTVGAAIHSVRAVPLDAIPAIAAHATGRPLHVHLSEQRLENEQSLATFGATPTRLLEDAGALGPRHDRGPRGPPDPGGRRDPRARRAPASACARRPSRTSATGSRPARLLQARGCPAERRQRPARPHRPARGGPLGRDARAPRRRDPRRLHARRRWSTS